MEKRLEALRGPVMPAEVEARLRQRLWEESLRRPSVRRLRSARHVSLAQVALLAVLLATAAWVVRHSVMPVLRSAWERVHCLVDPSQAKH
ncbi:MAG TPA: hypothetical protein VFA07_09795 [Chthonomonadaceae bacterium]|nr:hypothetical protein [Chthonomonadaceae bacterium]